MRFTDKSTVDLTCYFTMVGAFSAYTEIVDKKTTNQELIENYVYEYLAANPEIDTSVGKSKCDVARKIRNILMEQHREVSPLIGKEPDWDQEKIEQVCVLYLPCFMVTVLIFSAFIFFKRSKALPSSIF